MITARQRKLSFQRSNDRVVSDLPTCMRCSEHSFKSFLHKFFCFECASKAEMLNQAAGIMINTCSKIRLNDIREYMHFYFLYHALCMLSLCVNAVLCIFNSRFSPSDLVPCCDNGITSRCEQLQCL